MTYAKKTAARPARPAKATEPTTLDAAPVYLGGVTGLVGEVVLPDTVTTPVPDATGLTGPTALVETGETVTTDRIVVGTQVEMVMVETTGAGV
jgi:hypothetical protein